MKSDVKVIRSMGSLDIPQRISDGKFDASHMMRQWNKTTGQRKYINDFMRLSQTSEFIDELGKEIQTQAENSLIGDNQVIVKIKGRNTKKGKTPDQVWMHPYLFIKFSMWLNPRFEVHVIRFVYDKLVANRHAAGDGYSALAKSVRKYKNADYSQLAKALNYIVFKEHYSGRRNNATADQLRELAEIERQLAFAVDMGYIKTYEDLIEEMRRMYHMKWANVSVHVS